ncbi:putative DNA-binding protein [Coccomyxa subellipsoidea C-169]|uniref:DNA-binding protein n=1 Tax=Coccomyxa subellipsoidea (strain C-169) TaxID=574566 RepID=I0YWB0_COCSC|nr:putative DNA-binding protein [Coccomyxa subellipsoidea C-169]EIE22679.1 putative DNA-binding protein [Coccomyxa subellipsoidea C-169]|eukprot:XP_005647223.1 putative DNA-binding protein [Coccomyxa subellipsoidea C-169]
MTKSSPDDTIAEFKKVVNMTPDELQEFLESDDSNRVGWSKDGGESVGHQSGRRIVELLQKSEDECDEDDISHMRKVVGYVHRHGVQGPSKNDVEHSKWRYSLMNWGNDPLKE